MSFREEFQEGFKQVNIARKIALTLGFILTVLCDLVAISLVFGFVWIFGKTVGGLVGEEGVSFFWMRIKFVDVVAWGDFGTILVFIAKNLITFARSRE